MIRPLKDWLKRHWPLLRLRTIVFATLFTVAALPGIAAMFLRVYENTLVRQTEAELVAQGAALSATAAAIWPGAPVMIPSAAPGDIAYRAEPPTIDLSSSPILSERPLPQNVAAAARPDAIAAARRFDPIAANTKQVTLSSIILLDASGRIAAAGQGRSLADLPEIEAALAGRSATVLRRNGSYRATYRFEWLSRAAAVRVHHARPVVVDGQVVGVLLLSRSARSLFKGIYADRGKIALGIVAILVILILLTGILSRGIVRPIEALGNATRGVAAGNGPVPDPPSTAALEIQDLYRDFSRMAEAIDRRSRYLRDFAHAVSHEFKTPLAGIRGALEILSDHEDTMTQDERRRFFANADADAARLALLSTRLLELARADLGTAGPGERADLSDVLQRQADAYRDGDFTVEIELATDARTVAMPEAALDAILATFIENSLQAGARRISFHAETVAEFIRVRISDDGPGIAHADRTRVFEPFFTTRRDTGGTGLGLPIVKSLLDAAGGKVQLQDEGPAAVFVIELPRVR